MDNSYSPLSESQEKLEIRSQSPKQNQSPTSVNLYKINDVRHRFSKYSEETTTWSVNDKFTCVGRLKFYSDETQCIYLEVFSTSGDSQTFGLLKADWRLELIDKNDSTKSFLLGESSFFISKPNENLIHNSNDWILVSRNQLEDSQLIAFDGSIYIRWTVNILEYNGRKKGLKPKMFLRESSAEVADGKKEIGRHKSLLSLELLKDYLTVLNKTESITSGNSYKVFHVCADLKEIVSNEDYTSTTPLHLSTDIGDYSLRGTVKKKGKDTLYFYVDYCSPDVQLSQCFKWSAAVYNSETDDYLSIGESMLSIKDDRESTSDKLFTLIDIVQSFLQNNRLIVTWCIDLVTISENKLFILNDCENVETSTKILGETDIESKINCFFTFLSNKTLETNQKRQKSLLKVNTEKKIAQFKQEILANIRDIHLIKKEVSEINKRLNDYSFVGERTEASCPPNATCSALSESDKHLLSELDNVKDTSLKTNTLDVKLTSEDKTMHAINVSDINLLMIDRADAGRSEFKNYLHDYSNLDSEPLPSSMFKDAFVITDFNGRKINVVDITDLVNIDSGSDSSGKLTADAIVNILSLKPTENHAILLVLRCGQNCSTEDKECVDFIKKIFGADFVERHCILIMTYDDHFKHMVESNFQEWLKEQKDYLAELLKECNYRVLLFDKKISFKARDADKLNDLINMVDDLILDNSSLTKSQCEPTKCRLESFFSCCEDDTIIEEMINEADKILQQLQRSQQKATFDSDITTLEELLIRATNLYEAVVKKDNNTGVLNNLIIRAHSVQISISSEIDCCLRMSEYKEKLQQYYSEQDIQVRKKFKDKFENLLQEYTRLEEQRSAVGTMFDQQLGFQRVKEMIQDLSSIFSSEKYLSPKVNAKTEKETQIGFSDIMMKQNILQIGDLQDESYNKNLETLEPISIFTESKHSDIASNLPLKPPPLPARRSKTETKAIDLPLAAKVSNDKNRYSYEKPLIEIDLLLIGKTGSGKSALGNSILGRRVFESRPSSTSVTKSVTEEMVEYRGKVIKVVDGPGVADTDLNEEDAKNMILESLSTAITINLRGYHAFLLVLKFGERFTREHSWTIKVLKDVFGGNFLEKFCIIVMTHGDLFENNVSFKEWVNWQKGSLKELVKECHNRIILFDNKTKDKKKREEQLDALLDMALRLEVTNGRYTSEQFDMAQTSREESSLVTKDVMLEEESIQETSLILKTLQSLLASNKEVSDPILNTKLERLSIIISKLLEKLLRQDKNAGVLSNLISLVQSIEKCILDEIGYKRNISQSTEKVTPELTRSEKVSCMRKDFNFDHRIETNNEDPISLVNFEGENINILMQLESELKEIKNIHKSTLLEVFQRKILSILKKKMKV